MQNHSSYSDWADYDNFSPDITVEGSDSKLLPAYLSLIRLSDSAIQNLVSYFEAQEEPTIIVFFRRSSACRFRRTSGLEAKRQR